MQVPGNLVISAHSGAHSFDASLINVSHAISHFSFGKKLSTRMLSELHRLTPYLGESVDRLNGRVYFTKHDDVNANVTVSFRIASICSYIFISLFLTPISTKITIMFLIVTLILIYLFIRLGSLTPFLVHHFRSSTSVDINEQKVDSICMFVDPVHGEY